MGETTYFTMGKPTIILESPYSRGLPLKTFLKKLAQEQ